MQNHVRGRAVRALTSASKCRAHDVATPIRAAFPKPSFTIQLMAALAGTARAAPTPSAYSSDCVANIEFTCDAKRCAGPGGQFQ